MYTPTQARIVRAYRHTTRALHFAYLLSLPGLPYHPLSLRFFNTLRLRWQQPLQTKGVWNNKYGMFKPGREWEEQGICDAGVAQTLYKALAAPLREKALKTTKAACVL